MTWGCLIVSLACLLIGTCEHLQSSRSRSCRLPLLSLSIDGGRGTLIGDGISLARFAAVSLVQADLSHFE